MKTIKLLLGIFVIVGAFFAAFRIVPPYFYHYQFDDALETLTMNQVFRDTGEEDVRNLVIRAGHDNGVDLTAEQVSVQRLGGGLSVHVAYDVPVDLMVTQLNLHFKSESSGKRF